MFIGMMGIGGIGMMGIGGIRMMGIGGICMVFFMFGIDSDLIDTLSVREIT